VETMVFPKRRMFMNADKFRFRGLPII